MASKGPPGQVADPLFTQSIMDKVFTTEEDKESRGPALKRLYLESYSATLVDMKRTVEHSHEEPLVKMPEVEKLNRVKAFS
eukprot:5275139-Amphidinium_carterae.1